MPCVWKLTFLYVLHCIRSIFLQIRGSQWATKWINDRMFFNSWWTKFWIVLLHYPLPFYIVQTVRSVNTSVHTIQFIVLTRRDEQLLVMVNQWIIRLGQLINSLIASYRRKLLNIYFCGRISSFHCHHCKNFNAMSWLPGSWCIRLSAKCPLS